LKQYSSKLQGSILTFGRNIQNTLEQSLHTSVFMPLGLVKALATWTGFNNTQKQFIMKQSNSWRLWQLQHSHNKI